MAVQRTSLGTKVVVLASCLACLYVAGRLWQTTRELQYARDELHRSPYRRSAREKLFPYMDSPSGDGSSTQTEEAMLFWSVRPNTAPEAGPLRGPRVEDDLATLALADERLLGQIDAVEAGAVSGWACARGGAKPAQVLVYVDGVRVGEVLANQETPHPMVARLCELDAQLATAGAAVQAPPQLAGVGFRLDLPALQAGKHQVRAFVRSLEGASKQELNQSPLLFMETPFQPALEDALKRKDAIIRVRNAQVSQLWDELHTRQPWRNAVRGGQPITFTEGMEQATANSSRMLAVLGINTGLGARVRRDNLRRTWVPTGPALKQLEDEKGIVIRFVVGYSEQRDDPDEEQLQKEMREFGDILRIDLVDTYADLPLKTIKLFTVLPAKFDADFYFKVDDDVGMNLDALATYLHARRTQGNLYLGCMKSGQVLTDRRYKWYEPEFWRFGDPASEMGQINYMRHASGQIYGLSAPVARFIGRNAPVLHRFANEDVSLGAWLVGLEIQYVDERRICCDSPERCAAQTGEHNLCLGYYEHQCAGICSSEERLEPIFNSCLKDPLHQKTAASSAAAGFSSADSVTGRVQPLDQQQQ